jgi:hypothetical protein
VTDSGTHRTRTHAHALSLAHSHGFPLLAASHVKHSAQSTSRAAVPSRDAPATHQRTRYHLCACFHCSLYLSCGPTNALLAAVCCAVAPCRWCTQTRAETHQPHTNALDTIHAQASTAHSIFRTVHGPCISRCVCCAAAHQPHTNALEITHVLGYTAHCTFRCRWCTQNTCGVDWCTSSEVLDVAASIKASGMQALG